MCPTARSLWPAVVADHTAERPHPRGPVAVPPDTESDEIRKRGAFCPPGP